MALFDFLLTKDDGSTQTWQDYVLEMKANKLNVKEFGINKAAGMIAKVIAKSEFQVINKDGKQSSEQSEMYYMLNVRPNPNYDASTFWLKAITKALTDKEGCLIVHIQGKGLYIADSFTLGTSVMNAKSVSNVITDEYTLTKTFSMDECLLLKMGDNKIVNLLDSFYNEIGEMLGYAAQDFKVKNSRKWRMGIPTNTPTIKEGATGKEYTMQQYAQMIADRLADPESSVVSIPENIKLESLSGTEVKTSQDFRDLLQTALTSTALAYDIPMDIFTGQKTEKSTSMRDFITFACGWVYEMVEDEVNGKWFTKEEYISGTKLKIDKTRVQHVDFFDTADAEIKLILAGYSHNDLRVAKGLEPVNEAWANKRGIGVNNGKGGTNG